MNDPASESRLGQIEQDIRMIKTALASIASATIHVERRGDLWSSMAAGLALLAVILAAMSYLSHH